MYYNLEKTAEILDCTPGDVNRLREANKLRAFRDGASWKFRKEDVEKYLTDLIRERSKSAAPSAADLLNDSDDEELPTMLADSASFDAMIDATAEKLEIKATAVPEPDFVLDDDVADADLQIVAEPQAESAPLSFDKDEESAFLSFDKDDESAPLSFDKDEESAPLSFDKDEESASLSFDKDEEDAPLSFDKDDESASLSFDKDEESASLSFDKDEEDDADFGLALESQDDDLLLADDAPKAEAAPEPAAFAPEADVADDDLLLVADDAPKADDDESASVFNFEKDDDADALAGASDADLLHLGSDSGLSLLDDVDLSGSNVSLDGGDVVLGGSGSGSGLHLGSDSGLSLLGDDAEDFALEGVELQNDAAFAPDADDDDSIFELADDSQPAAVLELEQSADSDTATILGTGSEDFQLADDSSSTYEVSESEAQSQVIETVGDADPFFTKDEDSDAFDPFAAPAPADDMDPFGGLGAATDDANPFAGAVETPAGDAFGGFDATAAGGDAFGGGSFDATPAGDSGFGADAEAAPVAARAPETTYTGKDFLFLVPCLLFVLLATIGAYELCRTIWSYEEASFDITGPVLDMIANMVGLTK